MRQVPINQFKRNISTELKDLPIQITKRNKIVAIVSEPNRAVQEENQTPQATNRAVQKEDEAGRLGYDESKFDNQGKYITFFK